MATRADWDSHFGSGLREAYDFTILTASFGTDQSYNNGQTYLLILSGMDEAGEESTEMLSCGADWESDDGGFTVHHPKKKQFDRNSVLGKWCSYAGDAMETSNSDYLFDKNPLEAAIWNDTKWRLEEREVGNAFTDRKTGKEVAARTRLVPVAFLGLDSSVVGGSSPATPAVAPVAAPASPAPADMSARRAALAQKAAEAEALKAASNVASNGSAPSGGDDLKSLAVNSPDYASFMDAALAMDSVILDDQLSERVIDSGPNGYYATNH